MTTPSFALVGAVNHGKSSVAATIAENDQIGISDEPGKTVESQRFDCRGGELTLWDTPGFQNPREMLAEIQAAARTAADPLSVFRAFTTRHSAEGAFHAERELLRPLFDGAAILYVIDTSRPLLRVHEAEMELLRLTGLPRLAILNPTGPANHEQTWRAKLGQQIGAVHHFNAHQAGSSQRVGLLRTMATVADQWSVTLIATADKMEAEWSSRLQDAAQTIIELLGKSLPHARRQYVAPGDDKSAAIASTKAEFYGDLSNFEHETHSKLRGLFRHHRVSIAATGKHPIGDDLFHTETWKAFGMSWESLMALGLVGGAIAGAGVGVLGELALPGLATATGATIGGVGGATSAFFVGKALAQPAVKEEGSEKSFWAGTDSLKRRLAGGLSATGTTITVGPLASSNYPYILLDRAMIVVWHLASRAHARQDTTTINPVGLKAALDNVKASTEFWPQDLRDACVAYVKELKRRPPSDQCLERFRTALANQLKTVVAAPFPEAPRAK
jgi:hypothetical protein